MLRAIPHLTDYRPADANETAAAWRLALERNEPAFMALSRQDLPIIDTAKIDVYGGVSKGAYILEDAANPKVILIGTGSEVWFCVEAKKLLEAEGIAARVISFPSWELFEKQSDAYKVSVLPADVPKLAVEAGSPIAWWKWVGSTGDVLGLDRFGASAPGPTVYEKLGFTPANVADRAKKLIK
jgi:transketolase